MRIKIGTRLTVFWVVFTIFSLLAVLLPVVLNFRNMQRIDALERQGRIVLSSAEEISHFLNLQFQAFGEVEFLLFPEFLQDEDIRNKLFQRILFRHNSFIDIVLVDHQGKELIHHNRYKVVRPEDLGSRAEDKEFQIAKEKGYYVGALSFEEGRTLLTVAIRVSDVLERVVGVIIADIDMRIMQDVVKKISAAEEPGLVYVVNKEGLVIAHPDVSLILQQEKLSPLTPFINELARKKKDSALPSTLAVDIYHNKEGLEVIRAGSPISVYLADKEPPLLLDTDWFIIAELPTSAALAQLRQITIFASFILLAALLISITAIFLLTKRIAGPIEKVHKAAVNFGRGRLDYRVEVHSKDEMEDLAASFNQMADRLKQSRAALQDKRAALEIRVAARTKELKELAESLEEKVRERTKDLQERIAELERFHKLTVGRELKLIELKKEIKELEKKLVNKDRNSFIKKQPKSDKI